jgi:hypothetical protein
MSFWNNPEYNSIKVLMLVVLLGGVGYFVYSNYNDTPLGGKGLVLNTSQSRNVAAPAPTPTEPGLIFMNNTKGTTCTMTVMSSLNHSESITVAGTTIKNGACKANAVQATPVAQKMAVAMTFKSTSSTTTTKSTSTKTSVKVTQ